MKTLRRLLKQRHGSVVALFAAMLSVLVGLTALVVDLGLLYTTRVQLTNLADAAALAGVQELPDSSASAYSRAADYAQLNGKMGDVLDIQVLSGTTVAVKATRTVPLMFARIFGLATSDVTGAAAARINPVTGLSGMMPFGLVRQTLVYGQVYTIKFGSGTASGSYHGNFGALALGGNGASVFRDNIKFGADVSIKVGDWVTTETGNMVGPTKQGISYRYNQDPTATFATVAKGSSRIMVVPVIQSLEVNGRNEVLVVGFAALFLESSNVNNGEVTGRFMQMVTPGDPGSGDGGNYGLYASRLISYASVF